MKTVLIFFLISAFFLAPAISVAQDDPGGDPDAPFDGGLAFLVAAAAGYRIKKNYDAKKRSKKT